MLLALVALLPPLRPQPPGPALLSLCRGHSTNDARSQCQYRTYCWMPAGLRYSNWSRATSAPSFQSLDIQPPVIPTSSGATAPKITCNIAIAFYSYSLGLEENLEGRKWPRSQYMFGRRTAWSDATMKWRITGHNSSTTLSCMKNSLWIGPNRKSSGRKQQAQLWVWRR